MSTLDKLLIQNYSLITEKDLISLGLSRMVPVEIATKIRNVERVKPLDLIPDILELIEGDNQVGL